MGIFRSDPQPVQLTPHVPASALTTGSQPPRIASQLAMAMAVVGMAWPQPGEPHPIQPLQGRSQIAPLTLVYGQQPPRIDAMPRVQFNTVLRVSWPEDKEPRLQFNNEQPDRRYVAPLTLVYGSQPPVTGPLSSVAARSWDPVLQIPNRQTRSAAWDVPVTVSSVPFFRAPVLWTPADWSAQKGPQFAPLTLVYGDQPPLLVRSPRAFDTPSVLPQRPIGSAAWDVPAVISSQVPFVRQAVVYVPIDWSAQRGSQIAPLLLVYGQQPPVNGNITPAELNELVRSWDVTWSAQSQAANAGWNVPPIVSQPIPFVRQRHAILYAWQPPFFYAESDPNNAGWNTTVLVALTRAIAQSAGTDSIVASSQASGTLNQNSGIIAVISADSKTIQIITGNSGVISLDSDG